MDHQEAYQEAYQTELHSLIRDLTLYISQNYTLLPTVQPVKTAITSPAKPKSITNSKPAPSSTVTAVKAAVKDAPPKPASIDNASQTGTAVFRIMQALPRPFALPGPASLGDVLAKLQALGISTVDPPQHELLAKIAECIMISFYPPGSEQEAFIQKVANSITERLIPCRIYLQPGIQAATECCTLAASLRAKAFVLTYSQEDAPKVAEWLSYFGDDIKEDMDKQTELRAKRSLFGVRLYELISVKPDDTAFKRALWNDLQSIM